MSTKFAIIGVAVLGTGVALHTGGKNCPMAKMMAAIHHKQATTVVAKTTTPPPAKNAVAMK